MADPSIVTLTVNPSVDASCRVNQVVADRKLRCSAPQLEPGGGGINVARAARELGGSAAAVWTRGGLHGDLLEQLLDSMEVSHLPIPVTGLTRQNLAVTEDSSGRQYRFLTPGPELDAQDIDDCLHTLESIDPQPAYFVLSGSLPPGVDDDFYARVVRRTGGRVIVDSHGPPLAEALNEGIFLMKPNLRELNQLAAADRDINSDTQIVATARELIEKGSVELVVCSIGSGGAMLVTNDDVEQIRSPTVPIRSKVGAGDSMVAGIVVALARGENRRDSVRFGVAAGAAAVMTPGTGLCRRDDVERLYRRM